MVSGYDKTKAGTQSVYVTYGGVKSLPIPIVVASSSTATAQQGTTTKTADTNNIMLPASLVTIAMVGLVFVGMRKKSEERQ